MEFETGAVRSKDADNEAWYLISPIAERRLAKIYADPNLIRIPYLDGNLNQCIDHINSYLYGGRDYDHLGLALFHLFEYYDLEIGNQRQWSQYSAYHRFDAISPHGLRRLALRYRLGELKYGAYNMEKGMPIHDLLNHAKRHIHMHIAGLEDEPGDDNLGGSAWGLATSMHSEEMWPDLNKGRLRGPGCTITDDIKVRLDRFREAQSNKDLERNDYENWKKINIEQITSKDKILEDKKQDACEPKIPTVTEYLSTMKAREITAMNAKNLNTKGR